jgi:hypothetical protein
MIIPTARFSTKFCATVAAFALIYGVTTVFVLHQLEEYWALVVGIAFAVYPFVPKLPEEPDEIKPDKYPLFSSR